MISNHHNVSLGRMKGDNLYSAKKKKKKKKKKMAKQLNWHNSYKYF